MRHPGSARCGLVVPVLLLLACGPSGGAPPDAGVPDAAADARVPDAAADAGGLDAAADAGGPDAAADAAGLDAAAPDAAVPDAGPPPLVDQGLPPPGWYAQAERVADRSGLAASFAQQGYAPPAGTYALAVRVTPGVAQPAFELRSWTDTAFVYSAGAYWPASTVKLLAAVGALRTLGGLGLTGAATVSFTDDDSTYAGSVADLYDAALTVSDNVAYNRLMEIAGFDELNDGLLVDGMGLPQLVLQRRYTHPLPTSSLRTSPAITYAEGPLQGVLPARTGVGQHPECPNEGNCITLQELLDALRRVTLHDELPTSERFPLVDADVAGLMAALEAADTFLEPGASAALGHPVTVYNKPGEVASDDRLDHGLVVDDVTGERYLLAASMPWASTTAADLSDLAYALLVALTGASDPVTPLQVDAGAALAARIEDHGEGVTPGSHAVTVWLQGTGVDAVDVYVDRWFLGTATPDGAYLRLDHDFSTAGDRLFVLVGQAQGAPVGYRATVLTIP